jgi:cytochrome c oxidase subunit 4
MLRVIPRSSTLRVVRPATAAFTRSFTSTQPNLAAAHAISNPTLADIEKRWEGMPPQEQADLWMALRDRMKTNWSELTLQEKKAGMLYTFTATSMALLDTQWYCTNAIEYR